MTNDQEPNHQGASEPDGHTWAAEVSAIATDAKPSGLTQPAEPTAPFKHHVTIEALKLGLDGQGYRSPSTRGVVTEITVDDQEGSTSNYPLDLTVAAHIGKADWHYELYDAMNRPEQRDFTITWRGKTFRAMAYWDEIPAGVVDWQTESANYDEGVKENPAETAQDRLHLTVAIAQSEPAPDDALVKSLAYAVSESLIDELIKYSESNPAQRHLTLLLETTHGDVVNRITAQSKLGDIGIENSDSILDHDRFVAFLEAESQAIT